MSSNNKIVTISKHIGFLNATKVLTMTPMQNITAAIKVIPTKDLVVLANKVSVSKLVEGLNIITIKQVTDVSFDKLSTVLIYGNMNTVRFIQDNYSENDIINVLNRIPNSTIIKLVQSTDLEYVTRQLNGFTRNI